MVSWRESASIASLFAIPVIADQGAHGSNTNSSLRFGRRAPRELIPTQAKHFGLLGPGEPGRHVCHWQQRHGAGHCGISTHGLWHAPEDLRGLESDPSLGGVARTTHRILARAISQLPASRCRRRAHFQRHRRDAGVWLSGNAGGDRAAPRNSSFRARYSLCSAAAVRWGCRSLSLHCVMDLA